MHSITVFITPDFKVETDSEVGQIRKKDHCDILCVRITVGV